MGVLKRWAAIAAAALAWGSLPAAAQTVEAPWGLTWGQSKAEVEALGVALTDCTVKDDVEVCDAASVPDGPPSAEFYRLRFRNGTALVWVSYASTTILGDEDGAKGKALYEELRSAIAERYGDGTREETVEGPPAGFYDCLMTEGCGVWRSAWSGTDIQLVMHGVKAGEGYILLAYYRPD